MKRILLIATLLSSAVHAQADVPADDCRVIAVRELGDHPFVLSTSRHVASPVFDVRGEHWDRETLTLSGSSERLPEEEYELRVWVPDGLRCTDAGGGTVQQDGNALRVRFGAVRGARNWKLKFESVRNVKTVLLHASSTEGERVLTGMSVASRAGTSEARWAKDNLRLLTHVPDPWTGVPAVSNVVRVAAVDATGVRHVSLDRPETWERRCAWEDITREYARLCQVDGGEGGDLDRSGARLFSAVVHALWGAPGDPRLAVADPHILIRDGRYYLYGTSSEEGFWAYVSDDLRQWTRAKGRSRNGMVFARGDGFGDKMFWAPEVHAYKGKYYLFYSANRTCCVAVADSPLGPFRNPTMKPIFARPGVQSIDNSLFVDDDGVPWMPFSDDERFALARLTSDLMSVVPDSLFYPFEGAKDSWQKGTEEGPSIVRVDGKYVVLFSGDGCESQDYAVGVGIADRMTGPWKRMSGYRFLHRAGGLTGTGHGSPFQKADGSWHYVFHAHETSTIMGKRRTCVVPMTFDGVVPRLSDAPVPCYEHNRSWHHPMISSAIR